MKRIRPIMKLLKNSEHTKDVFLYFSYKTAGDDFDPEEENYTPVELNPICIKNAIVTQLTPEELVWKQYGLGEMGAIEIIVDKVHKEKFKICSRVTVEDNDYVVFSAGAGANALIQDLTGGLIRIILKRK